MRGLETYARWIVTVSILIAGIGLMSITDPASAKGPGAFPGANGVPFQALQQEIDDLRMDLQDQIDGLNDQIAELEADVAANSDMIELLRAEVAELEGEVARLDAEKQGMITGSCPENFAIRQVFPDGTVVCEMDDGEQRRIRSREAIVPRQSTRNVLVSCPVGWRATGGGFAAQTAAVVVFRSRPFGAAGWQARGRNTSSQSNLRLTVFAECVSG